jgi:hypothetical protein
VTLFRRLAAMLVAASLALATFLAETAMADPEGKADGGQAAMARGPVSREAQVKRLRQQILAIARRSPLNIERAASRLGSRLGPRKDTTPYRSEWTLEATALIAEGTATRIPSGFVIQLTPLPSLELAFQDFETSLLDRPYTMSLHRSHAGEDSAAVLVRAVDHVFRVNAGELIFDVAVSVPQNSNHQISAAVNQGFDTAEGKLRPRDRIREIRISGVVLPRWEGVGSLRTLRRKNPKEPPPARP